ncbi:MAG TPA: DUF3592 domain-containing protein [Chitinolyticbacter sp.]|nr:DUF3592 domain-containing protein [Chitinolyticbacter sp.]
MKAVQIIKYVFAVIGLVLFAVAGLVYVNTQRFLAEASHAPGVVIALTESRTRDNDGDTSIVYRAVVRYHSSTGAELEFTDSMGSNPPSYEVGEEVEVLYLPGKAHSAEIKSGVGQWVGVIVLGILGTVFFGVGAGIMLVQWLIGRKHADLQRNGRRIEATFQGVELNGGVEVNGRNPFQIVAHWLNPGTRELHVFNSPNIWFDPSDYIDREQIAVWIDPNNPKRYLVDLSFLPKVAN